MRVALLGFGKVAETTHLPGFARAATARPFEIVAVAEPSHERRTRAAELLPCARLYERAQDLLASERNLDLADVAAPPFLHPRLVLESLEAGLHVLCEKPLALDLAEIDAMARVADARHRVVVTVNNWRHAPLVARAIESVRAGDIGSPRFIGWSVRRNAADPGAAVAGMTWREDPKLALGGILVDHGWHALTAVHALLGRGPRTVTARLRDEPGKGDVEARLRIAQGGRRVFIRLTWRASRRANRARVVGTHATLRLEDDRLLGPGATDARFPEKLSQGSTHPEWFPPVLRALEDEILGRTPRGSSLDEARYCAATIDAAYRSAATGGGETPIA
jgi:predicted dehydrogenase